MPKVDVADERRAQIIEAALACFARKGYHLTTMDDIVAESGLSKGSLYWYFKSKKEIFLATAVSFFQQMEASIQEVLGMPLSPGEKLRGIARTFLVGMEEAKPFIGVMVDFWSQTRQEEDVNQLLKSIYEPYAVALSGVIEEGIRQGEFRPVNAGHMASLLIAVYDGLAMQLLAFPERVGLEGLTETLLDVLLEGLKPRQAMGQRR
ncbi:MAG: TetR/AcrR family transcriptional regulator [Anaerolineae bacterium]